MFVTGRIQTVIKNEFIEVYGVVSQKWGPKVGIRLGRVLRDGDGEEYDIGRQFPELTKDQWSQLRKLTDQAMELATKEQESPDVVDDPAVAKLRKLRETVHLTKVKQPYSQESVVIEGEAK